MDASANEVERISENQRYVTRVLNERLLNAGSAERAQAASAEVRETVKR